MNSGQCDSRTLSTMSRDFLGCSEYLEQELHSLAFYQILLLGTCCYFMCGFSIPSNVTTSLKAVLGHTGKIPLLPYGTLTQSYRHEKQDVS